MMITAENALVPVATNRLAAARAGAGPGRWRAAHHLPIVKKVGAKQCLPFIITRVLQKTNKLTTYVIPKAYRTSRERSEPPVVTVCDWHSFECSSKFYLRMKESNWLSVGLDLLDEESVGSQFHNNGMGTRACVQVLQSFN